MKITISPTEGSIDDAIKRVDEYAKRVEESAEKIAKSLADIGFEVTIEIINAHYFSGATAESLTCIQQGPGKYVIYAESEAILFLEFGAGTKRGYGHPMAKEFGYGPGTYPGSTHWADDNGWWFKTNDPRLIRRTSKKTGKSYGHSYGNAPHMPFYRADKNMRENILKVAKDVLKAGDTNY